MAVRMNLAVKVDFSLSKKNNKELNHTKMNLSVEVDSHYPKIKNNCIILSYYMKAYAI